MDHGNLPIATSLDIVGDEKSVSPQDGCTASQQADPNTPIGELMALFVGQLVHGCGSPECTESQCATGRRNISHVPIRDYTARSARAVTVLLLTGPNPRAHLCPHYRPGNNVELPGVVEGRSDPSSFMQQLSDTHSLRNLADSTFDAGTRNGMLYKSSLFDKARHVRVEAKTRELKCLLIPPYTSSGYLNPEFQDNHSAADLLGTALMVLAEVIPAEFDHSHWRLVARQINMGHATLSGDSQTPPDACHWLRLMDIFEHEPYLRLCDRICEVVAYRVRLEEISAKYTKTASGNHGILPLLSSKFSTIALMQRELSDSWVPWPYPLWLKKTFCKHWNGCVSVDRGTVAYSALLLLEVMQQIYDSVPHKHRSDAHAIPFIATRLDAPEMAQSWIDYECVVEPKSRHLLSFQFLFSHGQLLMYFRTINYIRMGQAIAVTKTNEELAVNFLTTGATTIESVLDRAEEVDYLKNFYLLLDVSRDNILRDTFDQLWQRRHSELLRPLRVRLGETGDLELGQDLGGVQIEFFNLVCKELFSEEAGMFTTESVTGLSYFRQGSLQPLYMFELFGLLVALAFYNGITIPASFPLALYMQLLDVPCDKLSHIKDGWPVVARSLKAIKNGEVLEMDYAFPMEANGFRMSLNKMGLQQLDEESSDYVAGKRKTLTLKACELSLIDNPTPHFDLPPIPSSNSDSGAEKPYPWSHLLSPPPQWPGWNLVPQDEPRFGHTVSSGLRHRYTLDYTSWLTTLSVLPQLSSFKKGFYALLPVHHISLFTPASLKATLEGSSTLPLSSLRSATTYAGFSPREPYINAFWSIVAAWPEPKQKALLKFVTAAERVPVAGNLGFRIERSGGGEEGLLPSSSTCFGTLYLPVYREIQGEAGLEGKLNIAVEEGVGFGMG